MSDLNVTCTNLGEVPYAFLDAAVYNNDVYAVQKYISGAECRLVKFDRNKDYGMLSFDHQKHTVKSACATLTDAALAVWGNRLYVFWKHTGSNWQVNYRSYSNSSDGKLLTDLAAYDSFTVTPDCHCYNYMDVVVFNGSLYLLMAVNRDHKDRIELRRCTAQPADSGELKFAEAVTFVSNGKDQVTDIKNSDTDTWDAQVWINPVTNQQLLIVGRIHKGTMTAYTWDGNKWSTAIETKMTDTGDCSSLKLVQAGALRTGDSVTDAMYFIYSSPQNEIMMSRYLPAQAKFDTWSQSTGTENGWMGATVIRNEKSEPKKTKQYQDEIHIISGKECHANFDTMVKSIWVTE